MGPLGNKRTRRTPSPRNMVPLPDDVGPGRIERRLGHADAASHTAIRCPARAGWDVGARRGLAALLGAGPCDARALAGRRGEDGRGGHGDAEVDRLQPPRGTGDVGLDHPADEVPEARRESGLFLVRGRRVVDDEQEVGARGRVETHMHRSGLDEATPHGGELVVHAGDRRRHGRGDGERRAAHEWW